MRIQKLKSKRGEIIPETLVALLFVTFGSVIFASLVMTSKKVISNAETGYQMFMRAHNTMEMRIGGDDPDSEPNLKKDNTIQKISIRSADSNLENSMINGTLGASEDISFYRYTPRTQSGGTDAEAASRYPYYFYTAR